MSRFGRFSRVYKWRAMSQGSRCRMYMSATRVSQSVPGAVIDTGGRRRVGGGPSAAEATNSSGAVCHDSGMTDKLARFACGRSGDAERREVKQLLQANPDLIPLLVAQLHELRRAGA